MASAVQRLTDLVGAEHCYSIPYAELLPAQMQAAGERLDQRRGAIKVLAKRAETGGDGVIRHPSDIVPLLFAHSSYKSYPSPGLHKANGRACAGGWIP